MDSSGPKRLPFIKPKPTPLQQNTLVREPLKKTSPKKPPCAPDVRDPGWRQYSGANLGGRLRIRVYYSTTTSSETTRKATDALRSLFDEKGICQRSDFEPWIPVDIDMPKTTRDKVFAKAGCRDLPLLFVDDEFVGGGGSLINQLHADKLDAVFNY